MSLRIDTIPNRKSKPQILLRQSWREGKRIRHKTILNLTKVPQFIIHAIDQTLKGGVVLDTLDDAFEIVRAWPHGHVLGAVHVAQQLSLARILDRGRSRHSRIALAAIVSRLVAPASKPATAAHLSPSTATTSLGIMLELGNVSGNEMLHMLDWLARRQPYIEKALANRHLENGTLLLYDVSSSYVEGRCCALAEFGYNRDRKKGKRQIVYGLLCNRDGCPIAVEVFKGNTSDPATVSSQVKRVLQRFGIDRIAMVGDRGLLTSARIREDLMPCGLSWISALNADHIRQLLRVHPQEHSAALDPDSLMDDQVAEIVSRDFPNERLMVCLNPRRRDDRRRSREQLLVATEEILEKIAAQGQRAKAGPANRDTMHRAIGAKAKKHKMLKHFVIEVRDDGMSFCRDEKSIAEEMRLDGIYIIRTNVDGDCLNAHQAVEAYKSLSGVERAFRSMKTDRMEIRPIYVYSEQRVRAHVFLCMLAWYLEWHMRRKLAPLLYQDDDPQDARAKRSSPVVKAEVSDRAKRKLDARRTEDGLNVLSMTGLIAHLGTLTLNEVMLPQQPGATFMMTSKPTDIQSKAFSLLDMPESKKVFTVN